MVKGLEKGLDLGLDAKRIKDRVKEYARKASNEEELKIKVEGLIQEVIVKFFEEGEEPEVAYEHRTKISGRREDALYGTVIIEYKAPKKLDTGSEFVKAKEQIEAYIKEESDGKAENFGKFFGVILDGYKISFVRFRRNQWMANEPAELSEESVYRLLETSVFASVRIFAEQVRRVGRALRCGERKESGRGEVDVCSPYLLHAGDEIILDPACGSGTFLVLGIKEAKNYAEEHFVTDKAELLRKIVRNVVGIDLNPLAVLASRANYVIALGDLIRYIPKGGVEIPVYLADSILVSRKVKFTGEWEVYLTTSEGEFSVPHEVIDKNLLSNVLGVIDSCVKGITVKRSSRS